MKILIQDKIYAFTQDKEERKRIKSYLTIPNPVYPVMLRKGNMKALYAIPKNFEYYDEQPEYIAMGRGNMPALLKAFGQQIKLGDIRYNVCEDRLTTPFKSIDKFKLRDYQEGVVDEIISKGTVGTLRLDTAWGKTILACELISKLRKKTLIIVPRNLILDQFVETIENLYNYKPGIIQGTNEYIKDITVASISTLLNRDSLINNIKSKFGMVLIDEIHQFVTKKRLNIIQSFNPMFLYGMTATIDREDGQGKAIQFTCGPTLIDKKLPQEKPTIYRIKSNAKIDDEFEYYKIVDSLLKNNDRNNLIVELINKEIDKNKKVLCLTKRISHGKLIKEMLNKNIKAFQLDSTIKDKEKLFRDFRKGIEDFDVIIGTYSLLSTGINLEILSSLIMAGPVKSKLLVTQSAGRCLRTMLNKPDVNIIDIVDNNIGIMLNQAKNRKKLYKEKEWKIID